MIHHLISPPTNRRFFTLFSPALLGAHKCLQCRDIAFEEKLWRLMSTSSSACEISDDDVSCKKKVVPPNQRKALVHAYVNQYKVMNDGKFPTPSNVRKHVGGGYYKVRAILQEYEYVLTNVATPAKNSTTGQIARVNEICDGEAAPSPNCQFSDDRITIVENCDTPPEVDLSTEIATDHVSHENMIDASTLTKHHERTTEFVSGCERNADLELGGENEKKSDDKDMSNTTSVLEIQDVPVTSSLANANQTSMAFTKDDPEFQAKSGHHTEASCTPRNQEAGGINESADQPFECDEFPRCEVMDIQKVSIMHSNKKQVGAIYHNNDVIIQDLDNTIVGDEMKRTFNIEETPDCQVSVGRIAIVVDGQVSTDTDSSSQIEADSFSCQKVIDKSILIENKEVRAYDVCKNENSADLELKREHQITSRTDVDGSNYNVSLENKELSQQSSLVMDTSAVSVRGTSTENCVVSAKPSLPSEVPSTSQNSDIDESMTSSQALKFGGISRGTTMQQTRDEQAQESSLWGNVKLLASYIINFWRNS